MFYGLAPLYLTELITKKDTLKGDRSFFVAAPKLWNILPVNIRRANTVDVCKSLSKSHVLKEAFGHQLHN